MFLSVTPYNFRNLRNGTIDVSFREVFFVGENGQGKSNLLETLYYSSYGNSFRTRSDSEIVRDGEPEMSLHTIFREEKGATHTTSFLIQERQKKIERDGKILRDRKELVSAMPCVLYSHEDLDFAAGEPERRRFFLDQSLSMYDVLYIDLMRKYKRILKSRNASLKERNFYLLDAYDFQLAQSGIEIQKKRKDAVFQFNQIFGSLYEKVAGIGGLKIRYSPSWKRDSSQEESVFGDLNIPNIESVMEKLRASREAELAMCTTLSGPHRDRIIYEREKRPFIPTASTGQRRLVSLVLRTAQAVFYTQVTGRKPVLLMDDVMLELDPDKRRDFTNNLPEYEQLFCTFLPGEPYSGYARDGTRIYEVKEGGWK